MTATSNNYAEALFMLASEQNAVDAFFDDLTAVNAALVAAPEYISLLSSPGISKAERLNTIYNAFGGRVCEQVLSFLQLLCEKGKVAEFFDIFEQFKKMREWASDTVVAEVKSAVELDKEQQERLALALGKRAGKRVVLKTVIDKSVLGGIVVTLDGEVIDGSVKQSLKHIREVIGSE